MTGNGITVGLRSDVFRVNQTYSPFLAGFAQFLLLEGVKKIGFPFLWRGRSSYHLSPHYVDTFTFRPGLAGG